MQRQLLTYVLLLFCLCAWAQPRLQEREYYVGVQAGVSSTLMPQLNPLQSYSISPTGGLVFRYNGHRYCGLQIEVNYLQRAWREVESERTLHYIEVPLLTHLYFGKRIARGYINIGPEVSYGFLDEGLVETPEGVYTRQTDRRFDWGIVGAVGGYFCTRGGTYQLEARYQYSMNNMFEHKAGTNVMLNPMMVGIRLGWMWQMKK